MLAGNMVNVFLHRPPFVLRHNQGDVLMPFDFPAPTFQFLVGVSLALFLRTREGRGRTPAEARRDAYRRFALLVLLGMVLDSVGALSIALRWGVLQTLGLGGAVATAVSPASGAAIAALAIGLLVPFSGVANGEVHADPIAALAFVPLSLAGLLVGRGLTSDAPVAGCLRRCAAVAAAGFVLAIVLYGAGIPFNKIAGTSSFVAIATGGAAAMLGAVAALEAASGRMPALAVEIGQNALMAWVLQYGLVFYPAWLVFAGWRRLSLAPGLLAVGGSLALLAALAVALGRRGVRIPI